MKKTLLLAGLAGMVAANAEAVDMTPYVGMDAGYASVDYNDYYYLPTKNLSLAAVLGARTDHYGVEAFYMNSLRQHKAGAATRISGYGVDALAFQQLGCSGRWELVGAAGIGEYKIKANYAEGGTSDTGYGYRLGGGLQYAMSENTSLRVMYHHVWMNKSTIDSMDEYTIGFRYAF